MNWDCEKNEEQKLRNPWETIPLEDYENHMRLDSVMQLQTMNAAMKTQFNQYPVGSIMILGIAGGNGLEHIDPEKIRRVYGIDINETYLEECESRFPALKETLICRCVDLTAEGNILPHADLLVANLLIEYIGYPCFVRIMRQVKPRYLSCIIQINPEEHFVSESPYESVFRDLNRVHHQMEEQGLKEAAAEAGYCFREKEEYPLPNGKKLVRMEFQIKK